MSGPPVVDMLSWLAVVWSSAQVVVDWVLGTDVEFWLTESVVCIAIG